MTSFLWAAGGLMVGGIVAWLIASARAARHYQSRLSEAENRASSAEGRANILDTNLARSQSDLNEIRGKLESESAARIKAEMQLAETIRRLDEEKKLLDDAKNKLTDAFKALAGDTLKNSTASFIELANKTFEKVLAEAKGDLGKREAAIQGLVNPLSESLKQFQEHVRTIEKDRQTSYSGLTEQVKHLSATHQELQRQTGHLARSLSSPKGVGNWGQMALQRVIELAGMKEHCDFESEVSVSTEEGRLRPDFVIHLPGDRVIVIDAKVSLDDFHQAVCAESEQLRNEALKRHAQKIRSHARRLGEKTYWKEFSRSPEYVVMFVPGESLFAAAVETDQALFDDAFKNGVIMTSPTTLIALLRGVAFDWRQEQIARNAQEISELGKLLYDRMRTLAEHLAGIGRGLSTANDSYNKAVGSIESRVLPAARRFKELGAGTGDDLPLIQPVESNPRRFSAIELSEPGDANLERLPLDGPPERDS